MRFLPSPRLLEEYSQHLQLCLVVDMLKPVHSGGGVYLRSYQQVPGRCKRHLGASLHPGDQTNRKRHLKLHHTWFFHHVADNQLYVKSSNCWPGVRFGGHNQQLFQSIASDQTITNSTETLVTTTKNASLSHINMVTTMNWNNIFGMFSTQGVYLGLKHLEHSTWFSLLFLWKFVFIYCIFCFANQPKFVHFWVADKIHNSINLWVLFSPLVSFFEIPEWILIRNTVSNELTTARLNHAWLIWVSVASSSFSCIFLSSFLARSTRSILRQIWIVRARLCKRHTTK